jgi:hypothetical protein
MTGKESQEDKRERPKAIDNRKVICYCIIAMLTKRTNLLLTEKDYLLLSQLANKKKESMGELIRKAIRGFYHYQPDDSRKKILAKISRLSAQAKTKGINYKTLVEDGRKY